MPSPTVPRIGRERGDARRHRRRGVNRHAQRRRRHPGIAGRIACRRRQAVRAVRQRRRRIAPGPAAVGHRAAQQRRTVIDLDRCVGFRRAGQRQRVVIGDVVAHRAAVGRERGDARCRRRHRINRDAHRDRSRTGHARHRVGRGETMRPVRQSSCDKAPGPAAIGRRRAEQRRPVVDIHRCCSPPPCRSASAYCRIGNVVADSALSVENEVMVGAPGGAVNCHRQGRRRHPGIAGRIGCRRRQAVRAVRQRRRRIAPGPAAVGRRAAQQRRTVKNLDRCVGFRRTGQRQRIRIGDAVTNRAAIGRERGDARRHRRRGVNRHAQRRRGHPGIAGRIARRRRQAVRAVRQRRRRIAPGPAAVGHRAAQQRRAVKNLDRCIGFRRTGQRQRIVIGDVVAHRAAVGRERGNARRRRRHRIDRDTHRDRSRTGHARHRVGRGETMHPVRQSSRDKAPGPAGIGRRRAEQRRPVVDIHRVFATAVPVSVRMAGSVM